MDCMKNRREITHLSKMALITRMCLAAALWTAGAATAGEALTNKEVLDMVKDKVALDVIQQKILNSACRFNDTSSALREIQKACDEAAWKPEQVGILQKEIMKVANQDQKRLKELVDRALNVFDNADGKEYELMMRALLREGRTVVPYLLNHVEVESERKRSGIVDILGRIGDKSEEVVRIASLLLYDPSAPVRLHAAECVAKLANDKTCDELIGRLNNRNTRLDGVAMSLGYLADARATEALTKLLKTALDSDTRVCASWALGELRARDAASLDALLEAVLDDNDGKLRNSAAEALAKIREKRAPSYIIKSFERFRYQPEPEKMIAHLRYFKDGDVVAFLIEQADSDNPAIKKAAHQALRDLTGDQNQETAEEWRGWWEVNKVRPDFNRAKSEQKIPDPRSERPAKKSDESIPTSVDR
jgi:hypothetical protein